MSFIRPEARAALWRWREVLAALPVMALGAMWLSGFGLLQIVGGVVLLAGVVLAFIGWQRARFRSDQAGPGVVQVDEGRVTYFGPLNGGAVDLREVTLVSLDPTSRPKAWLIRQPQQPDLQIPVNATGAEALFDAFATLPGLRTEFMLTQLNGGADHPVVIWQKDIPRLH
ncbi:hypothetical protein [Shimia biformata]|uniref:hypothetical protein n=1 Tax=Shimia biformata TaxID=1294299 RepID=UPI00194E4170|nr:hypothetical protein [Shimia biformata]